MLLCFGIYLHLSSVVTSQESCLGTVENSEHGRDAYLYYKIYK